ncbi:MAG: hypothetical protein AAGA86_04545 [Bacteroidota bacterium]
MKNILIGSLLLSVLSCSVQGQKQGILPVSIQIKTATLPLPEGDRDGAMVYGYDTEGQWVVLREGTNTMVCLADDPKKKGISVSCYSKKLDPFMKRGRELNAAGKSFAEKSEIRGAEVAAGKIPMPKEPSMMYVYFGSDKAYDQETGELGDGQYRYVIYTPFATTESTGLPDKPHEKGMPWLMDPGTFRAHIMVGPFE